MRKIGTQPLTGAEKQKRHRERVKARLEEAANMKERLAAAMADEFPGLRDGFAACLAQIGADADETEVLTQDLSVLRAELKVLLGERAQTALENLRAEQRRKRSSLLSRMAAIKTGD